MIKPDVWKSWSPKKTGDSCPQCNGTLVSANTYSKRFGIDRVYKCAKCKAVVGSPTSWAECEINGLIWKDTRDNACFHCPLFNFFGRQKKSCPFFIGKASVDLVDLDKVKSNEELARTKLPEGWNKGQKGALRR